MNVMISYLQLRLSHLRAIKKQLKKTRFVLDYDVNETIADILKQQFKEFYEKEITRLVNQ